MMADLRSISAEQLNSVEGRRQLMDRYKEFDQMMTGVDSEGCMVFVSINKDNITITTNQHNGWAMTRVYWSDGDIEEYSEGRWNK